MALAMACPCAGPSSSVRRISRSNVPCSSSMRSRCSLVDILGEPTPALVECQGEEAKVEAAQPEAARRKRDSCGPGRPCGLALTTTIQASVSLAPNQKIARRKAEAPTLG